MSKKSILRAWALRSVTTLAVLVVVALAPARAQDVAELIRAHVEELHATGGLEVAGTSIAARNLIPRIYEARSFAPAWGSAAQVQSLLELIDESYLEGLDPADYHRDAVEQALAAFADLGSLDPAARAEIDLILTDSVIRLGYHLRFGKVDPVAMDANWNLSRELVEQDPAQTIQAAIDSRAMREFASTVLPRGFLYRRLKGALADYRAIAAAGGWARVPDGPTLRPGAPSPRVAALSERLAATGDLDVQALEDEGNGAAAPGAGDLDGAAAGAGDDGREASAAGGLEYDGEIVDAVRRFQTRHGLAADGVIGPATLAALNVTVEERIAQLRLNLERARWVFNELDEDFVIVNIAAFRLNIVRDRQSVWSARVQVGQPYRRTPIFKSALRYLVFNPTWTVPPTILRQDIMPEVRRDPGYLATRSMDVVDDAGASVDPTSIDWASANPSAYRFVQRPGPTNALGRVKFMFPNDYAVYLHDTPSRHLFERESRAFSSGCIRVEHPFELALELLGDDWDLPRIDAVIASARTDTVFLDEPITIMLLYWTAEVDDAGRVLFWPDVYDRDAEVIRELDAPYPSFGGI